MYIYYPSCNFQKAFPGTARRIAAYLATQADARMAGCCHRTNDLPGPGDTIVTVCMSCMRLLDEMRSDVPQISLFEFLLTREDFPWPDLRGRSFCVQDCFRARGKRALQEAVRACLRRCGAEPVDFEPSRDAADFDGSFLLHDPYPQNMREAPGYYRDYLPEHVTPLPEAEWERVYRERAALLKGRQAVGYCNTCVGGLRQGGAEVWHLAELLFPEGDGAEA